MNNQSQTVRRMFSEIAIFYIKMNTIMTFGFDRVYRREVVKLLKPAGSQVYLDDGAGTGDLALEILAQSPLSQVVALDFTEAMMREGRKREKVKRVLWVIGDAQNLPFKDLSFDGTVSGFLMRKAQSIDEVLGEQKRVLRPEGISVTLDTTPPQNNILKPFILIYLRVFIPLLGFIFARNIS